MLSSLMQSLRGFFGPAVELVRTRPFSSGFLAGLAVSAAVLLVIMLLCLIFRSRRLSSLEIPAADGTLKIEAKAVRGVIFAAASEFPQLHVRKSALYGKRDAVVIRISLDFDANGEPAAAVSAKFRTAVAAAMKNTLGLESPAVIELDIVHTGSISGSSRQPC